MASIDKLMEANKPKPKAHAVTSDDLGGGKFMPQAGKLIPLSRIRHSPYQPRLSINPESLSLLAEAISSGGLDTPILVRPIFVDGEQFYELIDGHRRVEAATLLKWDELAANIREVTDNEAAIMALSANVAKDDYSPYEIGRALKLLLDKGHVHSKTKLEKLFGITRSNIYRFLAMAELPPKLTAILDSNPHLIGTTAGEMLAKMVAEGDEDLAHKGLLRVLDGEMKETHLETWWRHTKSGTGPQPAAKAEAVRKDKVLSATIRANKKGGFDLSVSPLLPVDADKLKAALMTALRDLKVVPITE